MTAAACNGDEAVFASLVVCDAEAAAPGPERCTADRDVRVAVGDVAIHLDADTPAGRIAGIVRALGAAS